MRTTDKAIALGRTKNDGLLLSAGETDEKVFEECPQTASIESYPRLLLEKGGKQGDYITAHLSQQDLFNPDFREWISLASGPKNARVPTNGIKPLSTGPSRSLD